MQPAPPPHFSNPFRRPATARACLLAGLALAGTPLAAQTVSTVRETEFRSRWVDQQVDRPLLDVGSQIPLRDADYTLTRSVPDRLSAIFRTGPVVLRAGLSTGWEYTSQRANANFTEQPSTSSFFAAPFLAAYYDRDVGPWTVSARYSIGYMYYFDRNYVGAGGSPGIPGTTVTVVTAPERIIQVRDPSRDTIAFVNGLRVERPGFRTERIPAVTEERTIGGQEARKPGNAIPSQSAGLDFRLTLSRLTVRSSGSMSYGSGFDTNRGRNQDRLAAQETLTADYQLTEYTRAGVLLTASYEGNAQVGSEAQDIFTRYSGSVYGDYFITGKSRLRLELTSGVETREFATGDPQERTYSQLQLRANLLPTEKLALEASVGFGLTETTGTTTTEDDGLRNVYSLSVNYKPTEKISSRLYFGLEATATQPEVSLSLEWTPRVGTALTLSAYQLSGASTLSFSQNRISRGFLASAQQRFLQRGVASILGGWEQYEDISGEGASTQLDPYSFYGVTVSYEFSRWMALEGQYRSSTQSSSATGTGGAKETRASLSLRLTF